MSPSEAYRLCQNTRKYISKVNLILTQSILPLLNYGNNVPFWAPFQMCFSEHRILTNEMYLLSKSIWIHLFTCKMVCHSSLKAQEFGKLIRMQTANKLISQFYFYLFKYSHTRIRDWELKQNSWNINVATFDTVKIEKMNKKKVEWQLKIKAQTFWLISREDL